MEFGIKIYLKILEFLAFSCLCFLSRSHAWTTYEFEPIQMELSLMGVSPLRTHKVDSIVQCAELCCSEPECKSFSLDCLILTAGVSGQCHLFDTSVGSVNELISSSLCYVQRKGHTGLFHAAVVPAETTTPTTTTEPTTTAPSSTSFIPPTTTTSASGSGTGNNRTIYDIVYGPLDMCSTAPSSQKDFLVIASDGVYYYDEVADLPVAPCKGPLSFMTVFNGYSELDIDQVSGMLVRDGDVELYSFATGKVYKYQISAGSLSQNLESNYLNLLGLAPSAVIATNEFTWCAYRSYTSQERHFFLGTDGLTDFFMVSNQFGQYSFDTADPVININSFNMNPWSNIPSNIVAACGYTNEPAKNFILIDSNLEAYTYELNHDTDNNNPMKVLTPIGTLQF